MARTNPPRPEPPPPVSSPFYRQPALWIGLLLAALTLAAYWPALHGTFLWDDDGHVTRPDLRTLGGLVRIWTEIGATQQYYPMLHSAFWLEHRLWGDAVLGYHLVNLLQHLAAAALFYAVLRRLAVPGALLAAALFSLHPVCVESVAWISEQKNTLSAVFYLAAALAYLRFADTRRRSTYALASALFVCALLTKTVTATLPAALLVIFWWQRGQLTLRRDVLPLAPWFFAGIGSGLFTAYFEKKLIGAQGADFALTFFDRLALAGRVFWFYLGKLLWPAELAFIYPRWSIDAGVLWQWSFTVAALALLAVLVWLASRPPATADRPRSPTIARRTPLAAALLFGGTLFPVLGFLDVYPFVFSYVADHFQYLASLAIFAFVGAGLTSLGARFPVVLRAAVVVPIVAFLAILTSSQSAQYRDVFALYQTTLARNPDCWLAHNNLAIALANTGRVTDAIPHLERALQLNPDFPEALNNLGDDLLQLERPAEALPHLEKAIELAPTYAVAHRNLGRALAMLDRTAEALPHFAEAARLNPADPDAELNWGIGLMLTHRFAEALPHFERACTLDATPNSHLMFGRALAAQHRPADAVTQFRAVLELDPRSSEAHLGLAQVLRALGHSEEAERHRQAARQFGAP